jgi:hypothetical protein
MHPIDEELATAIELDDYLEERAAKKKRAAAPSAEPDRLAAADEWMQVARGELKAPI